MTIEVTVNGERRELPAKATIAVLLAHLGTPARGIAVAKNDRVVRRTAFESEPVAAGDRIEIIKAVAGG